MNSFSHVPPGFRFHPTEEELVDYYLRKKINSIRIDLDVIRDVDLYKIEPWDLQELCRIGAEEQNEWYFFSHKDKKYPTGTRTNRATTAGFWKATGRDKAIYAKHDLIGMRKTLVFYKGRAPNGQKSDWIMHEYRLETEENGTPQEEGWVVCRVFKKRIPASIRKASDHESSACWYDHDLPHQFAHELDSPNQNASQSDHLAYDRHQIQLPNFTCKKELDLQYQIHHDHHHFLQLPLLQSPKLFMQQPSASYNCNSLPSYGVMLEMNQQSSALQSSPSLTDQDGSLNRQEQNLYSLHGNKSTTEEAMEDDQVTTDWRVLDKFVASQLSQDNDAHKENNFLEDSSENWCLKMDQDQDQNQAIRLINENDTQFSNISKIY